MATYNKQALIDTICRQTEAFLQKAISEWQLTDSEKMMAQPAIGKWSAVQCLAHLNSYSNYYNPVIRQVISYTPEAKSQVQFKAGWLGNYFTRLMLPEQDLSIRVKMPAAKHHTPPDDVNSYLILSDFIDHQEKFLILLEDARNTNLNLRVPISISKFIKLRLGDVLLFITAHNYRHLLQAERALNKAGVIGKPLPELLLKEV